jgi:hypothetical protein
MTTLQQPVRHATDVRVHVPAPAKESSAVTRARGLSDLMIRRPELRGVYKPADVASEAIRWSA